MQRGGFMRITMIAAAVLVLAAGPALAQSGALPQLVPAKSAPKAVASTPEMRSAAELALSSDPVFDDGTYQRIKEALLSYSDIQVRGGRPTLPAEAGQLAPGANGPEVTLLRRRLVVTDDLAASQEDGDVYDAAVVEAVKRFQLRHGLDDTGSVGEKTRKAL